MKKTILIGIGLASLLALLLWADKRFPAARKQETKTAELAGASPVVTVPIKDLQDHDVRLADYKGKVVLVNFWGTWCAPVKAQGSSLLRAANGKRRTARCGIPIRASRTHRTRYSSPTRNRHGFRDGFQPKSEAHACEGILLTSDHG